MIESSSAERSERENPKSSRGRPKAPDPKTRNRLIISLALLIGMHDFNDYGLLNLEDDKSIELADFWISYFPKNWEFVSHRVVPRKELESFAHRIFGISRITFIRHIKELIEEGLLEKVRLGKKGKQFAYLVKMTNPEQHYRWSQADSADVDVFKEFHQSFNTEKTYLKNPIFIMLLQEIMFELKFDDVRQLTARQVFDKYPNIEHAFQVYISKYVTTFDKNELSEVLQIEDRQERLLKEFSKFAVLYRGMTVGAIKLLRDDLVEKRICPQCILNLGEVEVQKFWDVVIESLGDHDNNLAIRAKIIVPLRADPNQPNFVSCPKCGYTAETMEAIQAYEDVEEKERLGEPVKYGKLELGSHPEDERRLLEWLKRKQSKTSDEK